MPTEETPTGKMRTLAEKPVHGVADMAKSNPLIALTTAIGLLTTSLGGLAFGFKQIDSVQVEQALIKQENAKIQSEIRAKADASQASVNRIEGYIEALYEMKKKENELKGLPVVQPDTAAVADTNAVDTTGNRPR